ncbi:unnamed protein product [Rhizoctonia solani]|uniref:F-box domain-containing protein n=1 Tax=Rhizoctonia solani TaxID=456999 RepID=A0A8H3CD88_9AGAM|nr:unnamed protein product [Rhizoctonia solani]
MARKIKLGPRPRPQPSMIRTFAIPEILFLICEQVEQSDLARLLPTSRALFYCLLPLVWKSLPVTAPEILMRLLPNGDTHLKHYLKNKHIKDIEPFDSESLVRFNLYAPYVKELALSRSSNIIWKKLLKLVDTRPILPNLEILKVLLASKKSNLTYTTYLIPCLTPTLTKIDYVYWNPYVNPHLLIKSVSSVARQCPDIHSLRIGFTAFDLIMEPIYAGKLAESLDRLQNLRVLELGPVALDPKVITVLGGLPSLESLTLVEVVHPTEIKYSSGGLWKCTDVFPLKGSFPNLQHLGVDCCPYELGLMDELWKVAALFHRLTSISIRMTTHKPITQPQFHDFICTIYRLIPSITSLSMVFPNQSGPMSLLSPEIVDILAKLPLQRLKLGGREHTHADVTPGCNSERFALAFPRMEYLRIDGCYFEFNDLASFAKHMPHLQKLSLRINIGPSWPSRDELSLLVLTPSSSQIYFDLQIFHRILLDEDLDFEPSVWNNDNKDVEDIAAGLHALWPKGVVCEADKLPRKTGMVSCVDEVNEELGQLHNIDGHDGHMAMMPPKRKLPHWLQAQELVDFHPDSGMRSI